MPKSYQGSIFKPSAKRNLYMKLYDPRERRVVKRSTPFFPGEEAQAREWMERAKAAFSGGETVAGWAREWMERRRQAGVLDVANDAQRFRDYIAPALGDRHLDDVEPREILAVVEAVRSQGKAPRTVRNVYSIMKALWRDARIEGRAHHDPCVLTRRQLGKLRDADLGWRAGAVFSRRELGRLVTDERLPLDRRVQYGLLGLAGLRDGEMAGLTWGRIQAAEPLARLVVSRSYARDTTKTGEERWTPVVPALQELLTEWSQAWPAIYGRPFTGEDLVLPVPPPTNRGPRRKKGSMRDKSYVYKRWTSDLKLLGMPHRRVHDLRRTLISLAKADGANESILRWGTHAPPRHVMGLYTSVEWSTLCVEFAKLRVSLEVAEEEASTPEPAVARPLFGTAGETRAEVSGPPRVRK